MAQAGAPPASLGIMTAGETTAGAETAAPFARLSLLDLPDDMLEVIASAVDEPGAHVALLGTCKRLRDAAYAAPCSLLVRTPGQAGWRARRRLHLAALARRGTGRRAPVRAEVGFPTENAAAAAHLLASVMSFLSTHKQVQSLTLRRCISMDADATADEGAGDHGGSGEDGAADGDKADAVVDSVRDGGVGSVVEGEGAGCSDADADGQDSDCVGEEQDREQSSARDVAVYHLHERGSIRQTPSRQQADLSGVNSKAHKQCVRAMLKGEALHD